MYATMTSSMSASDDDVENYLYEQKNQYILFLVEKSLANINCLLACLIACMSAEGQKNIRVDRRVIGVEELEYEVSF
jgi:hypothetical protein